MFNLYSKHVFDEAIKYTSNEIKMNGRTVNNLRSADDAAIIANSSKALQRLINQLTTIEDRYGFKINTTKTKTFSLTALAHKFLNIGIYIFFPLQPIFCCLVPFSFYPFLDVVNSSFL